ncbi:sigma-54-dependent transcriptional regulator [Alienimonas californiensis]|uniref:DNA-binding transcriptional regulator NtrC n=1 Tax=Alienimonas californiensis TaxID=2527989 RepID=A0A517PBU6_9PLAN|nr:sigma-54 dependent transcriptional regulator [Alienimonas californiensis]QDT16855.1 Transcriptional regulatory protein ZraR [Alienimonas californiensis]
MPRLLVIDDDRTVPLLVRKAVSGLEIGGEPVEVSAALTAREGLNLAKSERPDVVLLDLVLPGVRGSELFSTLHAADPKRPVLFMTAGGTSDTAIEAMKQGAFDYLLKPLDLPKLRELLATALESRRLMSTKVGLSAQAGDSMPTDLFVGRTESAVQVYKSIGLVAAQDVTVLVRGESGTGKELVARAIYHHGKRQDKPFMAINCAAIPDALLESELFGHEKGSFTGADRQRIGKFEQCSGGTIFLDEIGDTSLPMQAKMLRLLQEQRFERVGGNVTIKTDVRVIAATNRPLERMVDDGDFRGDLFFRLNEFSIDIPPLRERGEDVLLLVEFFLSRFKRDMGQTELEGIAPEAVDLLRNYGWPGNVRELQSVLRKAILHSTGPVIVPKDLPAEVRGDRRAVGPAAPLSGRPAPPPEPAAPPTPDAARPAAPPASEPAAPAGEPHRETAPQSAPAPAPEPPTQSGPPSDLRPLLDAALAENSEDIYADSLELMERYVVTRILDRTGGNQSRAAKLLGITRGSLRNKIRGLGITIEQVIGSDDD